MSALWQTLSSLHGVPGPVLMLSQSLQGEHISTCTICFAFMWGIPPPVPLSEPDVVCLAPVVGGAVRVLLAVCRRARGRPRRASLVVGGGGRQAEGGEQQDAEGKHLG